MHGSCVDHWQHSFDAYAGLHVSIPAILEHHVWIMCRSSVDPQHNCSNTGLNVSIPAVVEQHVESGGSSPEVDLLSNESFSWHPSSHSEEEDFDE